MLQKYLLLSIFLVVVSCAPKTKEKVVYKYVPDKGYTEKAIDEIRRIERLKFKKFKNRLKDKFKVCASLYAEDNIKVNIYCNKEINQCFIKYSEIELKLREFDKIKKKLKCYESIEKIIK